MAAIAALQPARQTPPPPRTSSSGVGRAIPPWWSGRARGMGWVVGAVSLVSSGHRPFSGPGPCLRARNYVGGASELPVNQEVPPTPPAIALRQATALIKCSGGGLPTVDCSTGALLLPIHPALQCHGSLGPPRKTPWPPKGSAGRSSNLFGICRCCDGPLTRPTCSAAS